MARRRLLARVDDGDESAWNELVERFAGLVWSVARSFRLSAATTDDVVQTVWLRLAEYSSRIREPERLAAWLATATRNEALRAIRGQQRVIPHSGFAEASEPTSRSIEDVITDDVTLRAVLQAFSRALPPPTSSCCGCSARCHRSTIRRSPRSSGGRSAASVRAGPVVSTSSAGCCPAGIDPKAGGR